jgi:two-component system, OmpR family, sensor histidine kinase KdpD
VHSRWTGSILGVAAAIGIGLVLLPLRSHLAGATVALVLVVPVVVGVIVGGYTAGIVSVAAGFVVYDFAYVKPYGTLAVGAAQNWVALGVYVLVMLLVAQVAAHLRSARADAQRREDDTRRLFELSDLLLEDWSVRELLKRIVNTIQSVFEIDGVTLLLPGDGALTVEATAGRPLSQDEVRQLSSTSRQPIHMRLASGGSDELSAIALATSGGPVGLLVVSGLPKSPSERAVLLTFANHAALALERAQLRAQALRSEVLEQTDRIRQAMLGAVSHDLRSPLATMKVASSTLLDRGRSLSDDDARELYTLLDTQTDRLSRLVTSLLDMSRYQAGALLVEPQPWSLKDLAMETLAAMESSLAGRLVQTDIPRDIPEVSIDPILIGQVLANLLDNAERHSPVSTPIQISASRSDAAQVVVSVVDCGTGVPAEEQEAVFESFVGFDTGGRAGLGLAIARAFIEAHGQRIWVEDAPTGGARFSFTVSVAGPTREG